MMIKKFALYICKKIASNYLGKLFSKYFAKKDYREVYKPISEASYLEKQTQIKKPKYTKLKQTVISLTIYSLMLSLAYNILLIRECAELKENIELILEEAKRLNDENQKMVDSLVKPEARQEFKRIEIKKEGGKYVEKYTIEPK